MEQTRREQAGIEQAERERAAPFVEFPKYQPFVLVEDAAPGKAEALPVKDVKPAHTANAAPDNSGNSINSSGAGNSGKFDNSGNSANADNSGKFDHSGSFNNWLKRASAHVGKRLGQIWHEGRYDIYLPFYTWHNPMAYDKSHRDRYNDIPWGGGLGKSFYDEDGDWHGLYAVAFADSNYKTQIMAGYIFLKNWRPTEEDFRLGLGFTAGLTSKANYEYAPLPLAIPVVGVGYKNFDLQAAYVPGTKNNGNVLFTWAKWRF